MAQPQLFGIIPTWWFWRELGKDRPIVAGLINLTIAASVMVLGWLLALAGLSLPAVLGAALVAEVVGLGAYERRLRTLVVRRRRALAAGAELPSEPSE